MVPQDTRNLVLCLYICTLMYVPTSGHPKSGAMQLEGPQLGGELSADPRQLPEVDNSGDRSAVQPQGGVLPALPQDAVLCPS